MNFSQISMGHLTAIGPLIQLLLGFKEPERCSSESQRNHFTGVDKYSWTSVTAILSWKTCPAFSVKQPLPECLNCTKWWMDQIMFLTLPRNCRAAGQCQGQCFQGAYCVQLVPHPALFVLPEHFLLSVVTHPQLRIGETLSEACAGQVRHQHCPLSAGQLSYQPN